MENKEVIKKLDYASYVLCLTGFIFVLLYEFLGARIYINLSFFAYAATLIILDTLLYLKIRDGDKTENIDNAEKKKDKTKTKLIVYLCLSMIATIAVCFVIIRFL